MKYSLFIAFLLSIFACTNEEKKVTQSSLSISIDSILAKNKFNGVILVTKEDQTIYQKTIGFTDIATKNPLKINDQFFIGSKDGEQNIEIGALGYVPGFPSACYFYPKSKINVIVLENTALDLDNFKNTFGVHTAIMTLTKNYKKL